MLDIPVRNLKVLLVAVVLLSSCQLQHISEFSVASAKTMQGRSVANGFVESDKRINDLREDPRPDPQAAEIQRKMAKLQDAYVAYFESLAALSDGKLTNFKAQYTSFQTSLAKSGFVDKEDAKGISSVSLTITNLVAGAYRQKKLKEVLEATDPTVSKNMKQFEGWAGDLKRNLKDEDLELTAKVRSYSRRVPAVVKPFLQTVKQQHQAAIQDDLKNADNFSKAVRVIATGHHKLTENSGRLTADDLKSNAKTYKDDISAAYKALKP